MIEDDNIHTPLLEPSNRVHRGRAAIHGEEQGDGEFFEAIFNGVLAEAVPFVHPMGQIEMDGPAEGTQDFDEQRGRGDPVHVVIAEDYERFVLLASAEETLDGCCHVGEQKRVSELFKTGFEKPGNGCWVAEAAIDEALGEERREFEGAGQLAGEEGLGRG